jgi:hypothetical protein
MTVWLKILIIYLATVLWSIITILYARHLIRKQFRIEVYKNKELCGLLRDLRQLDLQFQLTLPWSLKYTLRCICPIYNTIIATKMLLHTNIAVQHLMIKLMTEIFMSTLSPEDLYNIYNEIIDKDGDDN